MCGFVGYISNESKDNNLIKKMASEINHRGPDDEGYYINNQDGIYMAHKRLSIIDISKNGHQPMSGLDNKYFLVFNGEIYNYKNLKSQLNKQFANIFWKGNSDTEVVLNAIQNWGLEKTLNKLNGMYAFALWNNESKELTLARDRFGEKPLYYGYLNKTFFFGSELKSFRKHPFWQEHINREVISMYLEYSYCPDPYTIYENFFKLEAGKFLTITGKNPSVLPIQKKYWSLENYYKSSSFLLNQDMESSMEKELEKKLLYSVKSMMVSDVPLGAFLSGGIDSSLVVSMMQHQSSLPIQTFTIGFEEKGFNEAKHAKLISDYLGTCHNEFYVSHKDALNQITKLNDIWDEPFGDSSQIPTLILSKLTAEKVKVVLSGDGGDEVFGGYNRYGTGYQIHKLLRGFSPSTKSLISSILFSIPTKYLETIIQNILGFKNSPSLIELKNKLASVLKYKDDKSYFQDVISRTKNSQKYLKKGFSKKTIFEHINGIPEFDDFRETMMFIDTLTYLPGDILTKLDRATMAYSLEARAPFLDKEVVEYAWSMPLKYKINKNKTKICIKNILSNYLPREIYERPKMGFGLPLEKWLKGPLNEWVNDILSESNLNKFDILDPKTVSRSLKNFKNGRGPSSHELWNLLMLQSWLEKNKY